MRSSCRSEQERARAEGILARPTRVHARVANNAQAERWAGERFHDHVRLTKQEVGFYTHRNPDNTISVGTANAGDMQGRVDPLAHMAPEHDLTSFGHLHPTEEGAGSMVNEDFSVEDAEFVKRVQNAENNGVYAGHRDTIESHLFTPRGHHKVQTHPSSIGAPDESTLGSLYLLRPATAWTGGMGASAHRIRWSDE